MSNKVIKESDIILRVGLDEKQVPVRILWKAEDNPEGSEFKEAKAFLLSLFEPETFDTLRVDLWTKEMEVGEMDRFVFQSLRAMADTYYKATGNTKLSNEMQKFARFFGEETQVVPRDDSSNEPG